MSEQVTLDSTAMPRREGWVDELRATFALALPLVLAQVAQNALTVIAVVMLAWLGPAQLAGAALANAYLIPFLVFGNGLVGAVAPMVAQARGARNIKAVRRIVRQGFWAAIIIGIVLVPILWNIKPVFQLLGQDPGATDIAERFMHVEMWLIFPAFGIMVLRSLLSVFNSARAILVVTLGGALFCALANYALIFGNFGFPRLEVVGSAIATVGTYMLMFIGMLAYTLTHERLRRFHILRRFWKPDWAHLRGVFRIGLPIGLTVLAEVGLFTAAAMLMGRLGTDEVAAHAVALQCASLAFMVPMGIGMATTVRVGQAYGRGDREAIGKSGWTSFALGMTFMTCSCLLFLFGGTGIVSLFLNPADPANANAIGLAISFLVIAGLFQLVDGAQVVAAHALRGLSDTKIPMVIAIVGYWFVGLPVAWLLGLQLGLRGVGVWIGLAVGLAVVAIVLVARFAMRERLGLLRALD